MTCNIDAKGKAVRLIYGIVMVVIGLALGIWAWNGGNPVLWYAAGFCLIGGGFGIFEARTGWCVVRAMGFKTPV